MSENDTPESIEVVRNVLRELECFDEKWFASLGGYSAYAQLSNLELLVKRLRRQNEHLSRSAEQRNEAAATAQNAACICQEGFPGQIMYDYVNCPLHGTPHSKRA